ncbi:MAG: hypothetical protein QXS41_01480 [Candidatus Woesearchaeota archaeon]
MKKSMSGLIITVLLVAIAVALTAMFVGFISSTSVSQMESARSNSLKLDYCSKVRAEFISISVTNANGKSKLTAKVKNYGTIGFDGYAIRGVARDGTSTQYFDVYFKNGRLGGAAQDIGELEIVFNTIDYPELSSIEFYPLINITTPIKDTLRCDQNFEQRDVTSRIQ